MTKSPEGLLKDSVTGGGQGQASWGVEARPPWGPVEVLPTRPLGPPQRPRWAAGRQTRGCGRGPGWVQAGLAAASLVRGWPRASGA